MIWGIPESFNYYFRFFLSMLDLLNTPAPAVNAPGTMLQCDIRMKWGNGFL